MTADLANPRAKLDRANEHLAELHDEVRAFVDRDPYSVTDEVRADGVHVARLSVREYPPLRLGLILGDVLANWRSALDNLAYQLILLNGRTPGKRETIGFPLFDNERSFERVGMKRIRGVKPDQAAIIEGLQPYPGREDPTIRALATVNEYANTDKHRAIHPALSVAADAEGYARSFRREPISTEFNFVVDPVGFGRPLKDGMEIAHLRWLSPVPEPKPKMEAEFSVEIAFGERGLGLKALPTIRWHVNAVVECFAPDFNEPIRLGHL